MTTDEFWRRCSACKKPIALGAIYYVCNVSTCNQKRTGLAFCNVSCWEVHLPIAKHRKSWALEKQAPRTPESREQTQKPAPAPREPRRMISQTPPPSRARTNEVSGLSSERQDIPREILIVASRLKEYVRLRSGFNTSERVLGPLSEILRDVVDEAIQNAGRDERKTVLDRDIPKRR